MRLPPMASVAGAGRSGRRWTVPAVVVAAASLLASPAAAEVVVVAVQEGSVAASAGLRAGDVLRDWVRRAQPPMSTADASGTLRHPFDWEALQTEQGRLGTTEVRGTRAGTSMSWRFAGPEWGAEVRPVLAGAAADAWRAGITRRDAGDAAGAVESWLVAAEGAAAAGGGPVAVWLSWIAGRLLAGVGSSAEADGALAAALPWAAGDEVATAALWEARGAAREAAGDAEGAAQAYGEALAARERGCGECLSVARTLVDLGFVAQDAGDAEAAEGYFRRAVTLREKLAPGTPLPAFALNNLGGALKAKGDLDGAEAAQRRALALLEDLDPESADVAHTLKLLGGVMFAKGDLCEAEACFRRALAIREKLAPDSLDVASSLSNLAVVLQDLGKLDESEALQRRALALRESLAPDSLDLAASLNNLASLLHSRGDLAEAERLQRRALALRESLAPESADVAGSLSNLGTIAYDRGRYAEADALLLRAVRILEKAAPDGAELAGTLANLGIVARQRGELDASEAYQKRALAILETLAPESPYVGNFLVNLGNLAWERGSLDEAEAAYRRSLALWEQISPNGAETATAWLNLGSVAFARGDHVQAEERFRKALAIERGRSPRSVEVASILSNLAAVSLARKDAKTAKQQLDEALAIQEELAPGSALEAELLHELGKLAWQEGHRRRATALLKRAVAALEAQMANLGGAEEVRAAFRGNWIDLYNDLMRLLVERGRPEEAYTVLERSRAQVMLSVLATRDLDLSRDVPLEIEREWRRVSARLRDARAAFADADPAADKERVRSLRADVQRLEGERAAVLDRMRASAAGAASLRDPRPLDAAAAVRVLPADAVLLAYALGESSSLLFVVTPAGRVDAVTLRATREDVRRSVARLRAAILGEVLGGAAADERIGEATALYALLVQPAEHAIEKARRVIVSPDGALHLLPFAALLRPAGAGRPPQPLVQWRPISVAPSMSVLAELGRGRQGGQAAGSLVAFGDPSYPQVVPEDGDAVLRSVLARTGALEPLPGTRAEIEAIATAFPAGAATVRLGPDATEESATSMPRDSRIVHFACHGFVDADFPLDSALALTIPVHPEAGRENGLLQAWEILERLRVNADLVTLSACETGLGREVSGEGLLGLTRAFHYAGARAVLASLWPVADESTAALMAVFYRSLLAGKPKDDALRDAQLSLLSRPEFGPPFFWAAFQLVGQSR